MDSHDRGITDEQAALAQARAFLERASNDPYTYQLVRVHTDAYAHGFVAGQVSMLAADRRLVPWEEAPEIASTSLGAQLARQQDIVSLAKLLSQRPHPFRL